MPRDRTLASSACALHIRDGICRSSRHVTIFLRRLLGIYLDSVVLRVRRAGLTFKSRCENGAGRMNFEGSCNSKTPSARSLASVLCMIGLPHAHLWHSLTVSCAGASWDSVYHYGQEGMVRVRKLVCCPVALWELHCAGQTTRKCYKTWISRYLRLCPG